MRLLALLPVFALHQGMIPTAYIGHYSGSWSSSVPISDTGTTAFNVSSTGVLSGTYHDNGISSNGTITGRVFSNGVFTITVSMPNSNPPLVYNYGANGLSSHSGSAFSLTASGTGTYGGVTNTSFTTAFTLTKI